MCGLDRKGAELFGNQQIHPLINKPTLDFTYQYRCSTRGDLKLILYIF